MDLVRRTLAAFAVAAAIIVAPPTALPNALAAFSCNASHPNPEFRWAIKSLSDVDRHLVNFTPLRAHIRALRHLARPDIHVRDDTPRIDPEEMTTYRIRAGVVQAKLEDDGDVILVLSIPGHRHRTMVVEFANPSCVTRAFMRPVMARARREVLDNCGPLGSHFTPLRGSVRVRGVGFWDQTQSEHGAAPNGFQLWPVLSIRGRCSHA